MSIFDPTSVTSYFVPNFACAQIVGKNTKSVAFSLEKASLSDVNLGKKRVQAPFLTLEPSWEQWGDRRFRPLIASFGSSFLGWTGSSPPKLTKV